MFSFIALKMPEDGRSLLLSTPILGNVLKKILLTALAEN